LRIPAFARWIADAVWAKGPGDLRVVVWIGSAGRARLTTSETLMVLASSLNAADHVGQTEAVLVDEVAAPNNFVWQNLTHGAMHAHAHNGNLVVSWFGGTEEGEPDVSVWVTVKENGSWVKGMEVDNGGRGSGEPRVDNPGPMWQSPLFQPDDPKAPLVLHLHPGG